MDRIDIMKKEDLLAITKEAAKNIKTEQDLSQLTKMLSKITMGDQFDQFRGQYT